MQLHDYLNKLGKISFIKQKILTVLWEEGTQFPRNWVDSKVLLEKTNQKYFDRRIRELRDHKGCNIEAKKNGKSFNYRLVSDTLLNTRTAPKVSQKNKDAVLKNANNFCAVCGKHTDGGIRGLQVDHRVPLSRNGGNNTSNLQALCNECNLAKRQACRGCSLDCNKCAWAFPSRISEIKIFNYIKTAVLHFAKRIGVL